MKTQNLAKIIGNIFLAGALALGSASLLGGCSAKYSNYRRHPVEQVLRDHDGYRVIYTGENGVMQEEKYFESGVKIESIPQDISGKFKVMDANKHIILIKDLEQGEPGYADVIDTEWASTKYVEIHLPKDKSLESGVEAWTSGKTTKHAPMSEIK
jgi:hypothetical protein